MEKPPFKVGDEVICCEHSSRIGKLAKITVVYFYKDVDMVEVEWGDGYEDGGEFFSWRFRHLTPLDKVMK